MVEKMYTVSGMSCNGCESAVENALSDIAAIDSVDANHEADCVTVEGAGELSDELVHRTIVDAGYDVD